MIDVNSPTRASALAATTKLTAAMLVAAGIGVGIGVCFQTFLWTMSKAWGVGVQAAAIVSFAVGSLQVIEYRFSSFDEETSGEITSRRVIYRAYAFGCLLSGLYLGWSTLLPWL